MNILFLFFTLAVATAQDWCIDEQTGMMACLAGSPMWEKMMKAASQCGGDNSEVRSLVPEFLLNRQNNSCPTIEELDESGVASDPATCILGSMGYLHTKGGVKHGKVKRDIAKLNPQVVEKYSGGILTDDDPSGYKQCIDNSYIKQMIPDMLESCQDTYQGNRRYKKQIKRYMNRYAAMTCLHKLSSACSDVLKDQITALAYPAENGSEPITGAGYGTEPLTGAGYGSEPITGTGYGSELLTGAGYGSEPITGYGYG